MDSLITMLLLFVCGFGSGLCDESSERFTFDPSISHMTTYITTESWVTHIEMDQHIDGNLLFSDGSSLKTTDGKITRTVAGQVYEKGYREGVGESARFSYIASFHQLTSSKVVVVDRLNNCLRQVDRISGQTEVFSGTCTKAGYADGSQALFRSPWSVILDNMNQDQLLVTDIYNKAVRHVDIHNGVVSTFFKFNLRHPFGITQDLSCGDLYMTTSSALYQLNYQTKELRLIAGSPTQKGFRDGEFSITKFNITVDLIRIDKGRKLIVADYFNHRLRVLDRETNTSYSICTGANGHIDGDMNSCTLYWPDSLMVSGDSLYIGESKRIRRMSGHDACGNITRILQPGEKLVGVIISPGQTLQLPAGEYRLKLTTNLYNCTVHISITEGQANSTDACGNITKILQPGEKSTEVIISPEQSLQLPAGEYFHKITGHAYNCTVRVSITEGENVDRDEEEETTTTGTIDIVVAVLVITVLRDLSRYLSGRGPLEPVEREDGGVGPLEPEESSTSNTYPSEDVNDLGSSDSNRFNNQDNKTLAINSDGKIANSEPKQTNLSSVNTTIKTPETSGLNINESEEQNIKKKINYDMDKVNMGSGPIDKKE